MSFDEFEPREIRTRATIIFVRHGGAGAPVLLLHGFPETHMMWRDVAPLLARHFTVICADLRGYGQSGCPRSSDDRAAYSKRAIADELVEVMEGFGHKRFSVVGHDRGGRVAYRMAMDHPERIDHLATLDILPVAEVWDRADRKLALGYWPWSLLAQPAPLPERMMLAAPDTVVDNAMQHWGTSGDAFPPAIRQAYVNALSDPAHVHAICEEYRAAATIDDAHDRDDLAAGRRIQCPTLALWSRQGPLETWYQSAGGPLAIWQRWAVNVTGRAVEGGHFFPEEHPDQLSRELIGFLRSG
jgi:haloacetate dehalogenase